VRWVQRISQGGNEGRYTAYVVLDADARRLQIPLAGVSEVDAAAMVATGAWKYVYEIGLGDPVLSGRSRSRWTAGIQPRP
jgi:hypothetical protein